MRKKIIIISIGFLLLSLVMFTLYNSNNTLENKKTERKKTYAIMVQNEDKTGYIESTSNTIPSDMILNTELTNCTDEDGIRIENAISFENGSIVLETNKKLYCYLYFDRDSEMPVVTAESINNNTDNARITITSSKDGIYCINKSSVVNNMDNCITSNSNKILENQTILSPIIPEKGSYYVHFKDESGNFVISNEIKIKLSPILLSEYLLNNPTTGLNTTLEAEMYRYQGISVNNYVCFGTSSRDTCLSNQDTYMYRIIGITEDGRIKLIKKTKLANKNWGSSSTSSVSWVNSAIYSYINGSSYLGNTTYVPSEWQNLISSTVWRYQTYININQSAYSIYITEMSSSAPTVTAKVALMYLHDYYYSYQSGGLNCSTSGSYTTCKNSWLNPKYENLSYEYTMIASNYDSGDGNRWIYYISNTGYAHRVGIASSIPIRPVFFLSTQAEYISGTGSSDNPFIILE